MPGEETERSVAAGRPQMPGYGIHESAEGILPWSWAVERLHGARNYWVSTSGADGRPHVMPVWGVWLGDTLYFSTGRQTRKARNLARNPMVAVHLESGDEVVILEGEIREIKDFSGLAHLDNAYAAKYINPVTGQGFRIIPEAGNDSGVYALQPQTAFAWTEAEFPKTASRWRFSR